MTNPYESPDTPGKVPVSEPARWRFSLFELLAVVGVIGVLIALLLPTVRHGGPSRRGQCSNNLKQIMLALHNYHEVHQSFPPAYTVDAKGRPLHSWRTLILPYLEQQALYDKIDLSKPWDDPANKFAYDTVIQIYTCPSVPDADMRTTYLASVGPGSAFDATKPRSLHEIRDNRSFTMSVVDVDATRSVHWMSPHDANEQMVLNLGSTEKLSHPGSFSAACADGSVKFIGKDTAPEILRALISIAGDDDAVAEKLE